METKVKHNYKVGDVILEEDGWGKIITSANMGGEDVYTYLYINTRTLALSSNFYPKLNSIPTVGTRLFNLLDLFGAAKEAANEDTNT